MVIKIDNTPGKGGDSSVEVEYSDSETPIITTRKQGQRPHSIAGHPTTPGDKDELWWDEDFEDIPLTSTEPDSADAHIEEILSDPQEDDYHESGEFIEDGQFEDIDGYHGHLKTQEQISQGDTDEWEDCETEEYFGTQESSDSAVVSNKGSKSPNAHHSLSPDDALKLSITGKVLNPDAPVFTPGLSPTSPLSPLSPEMMKTPEGHVKVENWAAEMKTPVTSPENNISAKASPVSSENSPASTKGNTKEGTSQVLPRRIENEFVSPEKEEKVKEGGDVDNESTKDSKEKTAESSESRDESAVESSAENSEKVSNETDLEKSDHEESEKTPEVESVDNKESNLGETVADAVKTADAVEESTAEKKEETAVENEETKQMAKTEDSETGRSQDPSEEESTTQDDVENAEGKTEGSSQNDIAPEQKGTVALFFAWL